MEIYNFKVMTWFRHLEILLAAISLGKLHVVFLDVKTSKNNFLLNIQNKGHHAFDGLLQ